MASAPAQTAASGRTRRTSRCKARGSSHVRWRGCGQAIAHHHPRALRAADLIASANATAGSVQCYLVASFTATIWLFALVGQPPLLSGHESRELTRGAAKDIALITLFTLGGLNVRFTPLIAEPVSDLLDKIRHVVPHYPGHAHYRRRGRRTFPPRHCPPPACRRPLRHRHPHPTSPLHRRHRRNGHPPSYSKPPSSPAASRH